MPTVEFDPFSREYFDDPTEIYAQLREHAPCYHSEKYDFYAFSLFDDCVAVHRDTTNFTSTHGLMLILRRLGIVRTMSSFRSSGSQQP